MLEHAFEMKKILSLNICKYEEIFKAIYKIN